MRKYWIVLVLLTILGLPQGAFAWNFVGHMTVALIAYRQLSVDEKAALNDILKQHPHYKLYLTEGLPPRVSEEEYVFMRAAAWPDMVRPARPGDPQFKDATITKYNRPSWHYSDDAIPVVGSTTRPAATQPTTREINLAEALKTMEAELAAADTVPAERAVALAWIEHLVGDAHQPLHAGSLYNDKFPKGDKGGNDQAVNTPSGVVNLHAFWDDLMGTSQSYTTIDFLARDIAADPRCVPTNQSDFAAHTNVDGWLAESGRYAASFVYLDGHLKTASMKDYQKKLIADVDVPMLPAMYVQNARDLGRLRIEEAGTRLATTLHTILAFTLSSPPRP